MTTGIAYYFDDRIDVTFAARMVLNDYGVPMSPQWWEPDWDTLKIESLAIDGKDVNPKQLPQSVLDEIYNHADGLEWRLEHEDYD